MDSGQEDSDPTVPNIASREELLGLGSKEEDNVSGILLDGFIGEEKFCVGSNNEMD